MIMMRQTWGRTINQKSGQITQQLEAEAKLMEEKLAFLKAQMEAEKLKKQETQKFKAMGSRWKSSSTQQPIKNYANVLMQAKKDSNSNSTSNISNMGSGGSLTNNLLNQQSNQGQLTSVAQLGTQAAAITTTTPIINGGVVMPKIDYVQMNKDHGKALKQAQKNAQLIVNNYVNSSNPNSSSSINNNNVSNPNNNINSNNINNYTSSLPFGIPSSSQQTSQSTSNNTISRASSTSQLSRIPSSSTAGLASRNNNMKDRMQTNSKGFTVGTAKSPNPRIEEKPSLAPNLLLVLEELGIEKYVDIFISNGFNNSDSLKELNRDRMTLMGIPPGFQIKILKRLEVQAGGTTAGNSTNSAITFFPSAGLNNNSKTNAINIEEQQLNQHQNLQQLQPFQLKLTFSAEPQVQPAQKRTSHNESRNSSSSIKPKRRKDSKKSDSSSREKLESIHSITANQIISAASISSTIPSNVSQRNLRKNKPPLVAIKREDQQVHEMKKVIKQSGIATTVAQIPTTTFNSPTITSVQSLQKPESLQPISAQNQTLVTTEKQYQKLDQPSQSDSASEIDKKPHPSVDKTEAQLLNAALISTGTDSDFVVSLSNIKKLKHDASTSSNERPITASKSTCWQCYCLVAAESTISAHSKRFCSQTCLESYETYYLVKCDNPTCGKTINKQEATFRLAKWYCIRCEPKAITAKGFLNSGNAEQSTMFVHSSSGQSGGIQEIGQIGVQSQQQQQRLFNPFKVNENGVVETEEEYFLRKTREFEELDKRKKKEHEERQRAKLAAAANGSSNLESIEAKYKAINFESISFHPPEEARK